MKEPVFVRIPPAPRTVPWGRTPPAFSENPGETFGFGPDGTAWASGGPGTLPAAGDETNDAIPADLRQALPRLLEQIERPAYWVDRHGRIILANAAARADGPPKLPCDHDVGTRIPLREGEVLVVRPGIPSPLEAMKEVVLGFVDGVVICEERAEEPKRRPIVFANQSMSRITGYALDELRGQEPQMLQGPRTSPRDKAHIYQSLAAGRPFEAELLNYRKDGEEYVAHLTVFPLRLTDGPITHWVSIHRDVTESRHQERLFQEAQRLDSMGLLAGGIAHDFNNLITAIMGSTMLLEYRLTGPEDRELLHNITAAGSKAAELCRELLAYSGKGKTARQPVRVSELVQETTQLIRVSLSPKATVVSRLASDLPAVEIDPIQMRQIVMNLVINASDALQDRDGTITLATRRVTLDRPLTGCRATGEVPPGDWVEIAVTDTGCGMSVQVQQQLFEPFFTTKPGGHGLGMPAVLGIVRRHGGHILCDSRPNTGTTFRVLFPAIAPAATSGGGAPAARPRAGLALVADDDPMVRPLLVALLRNEGYETIAADDGEEALRLFTERAADLTLVAIDHSMPKMDGLETIAAMRRVALVPTILVTAFRPRDVQPRIAGTDHAPIRFLAKPFTATELRAVLVDVVPH